MFIVIPDDAIWPAIEAERNRVLSYLHTLTEAEWDHQSQCEGWRVRDVVAHLAIEYTYTFSNSAFDFIRSGFRVNKFLEVTAVMVGNQPIPALLKMFEATVHVHTVPKTLSPFNALSDLLIHEQDIRIALMHTRPMPKSALRLIFSHWEPEQYNLGEKITGVADRVKGLRFVATDIDIIVGSGEEVRGSAQDILLAITGRQVAKDALSGTGSALLFKRNS